MRPLFVIVISAIFGFVVCVGAFLVYVYGGNFTDGFSTHASDWSAFGSYFGGVVGPQSLAAGDVEPARDSGRALAVELGSMTIVVHPGDLGAL